MPVIYRSAVTRWTLTVVGLWVGWVFLFGDPHKWRAVPSLRWLAGSHIPFGFWGAALIVYALLIIPARTRPVAFAFGGAIWAVFAVSLLATAFQSGPRSAVAIGAVVDLVAFHGYAVKTSMAANEAERGEG